MPYIICPTHGGNRAADLCPHLAEFVRTSKEPCMQVEMCPVTVTFEGVTMGRAWLCSECAALYEIPPEGLVLAGEPGLDIFWVKIVSKAVCPACFNEKVVGAPIKIPEPASEPEAAPESVPETAATPEPEAPAAEAPQGESPPPQ